MPGELTPAEYYHSYVSSQRRVERWVVETDKELKLLGIYPHVHSRDQPAPLTATSSKATDKAAAAVEREGAEGGREPEQQALPTPAPTNVVPAGEQRRSREVQIPVQQQAAHEADVRTSRRHRSVGASPRKRSRSRPVDEVGRSRSRPSTKSRKTRTSERPAEEMPRLRSRSKDARKSSTRTHRKHRTQQASSSLSTYLLYGALPVIYAMTGSSALLLLITVVLGAGYLYHMETPSKTKLHS